MGLKLIFLIVSRVVSLLGLSRREAWWKDAEILVLRRQLSVALSRSENSVSWCELGFAAGSVAWLAPSRGPAVAALPVGEVLVRPAGGAGPL